MVFVDYSSLIEFLKKKLPEYIQEKFDISNVEKHFTCPFHEDNTPSVKLHKSNEFTHCFSCNRSLSIFNYVQEFEEKCKEKEFLDIVKWIANKYNVKYNILTNSSEKAILKYNYYRAYQIVEEYIKEQADKNPTEAFKKEVTRRKWAEKSSINLGLGCVNDFQDLKKVLLTNDLTEEFIKLIGLDRADMFNPNNIIFSVYNSSGKCIAFYCRDTEFEKKKQAFENRDKLAITNKSAPSKFTSTSNFPGIYEKILCPYGIQDVKHFHKVILVEGHGCRLNLRLNGVDNVIALGGTGLDIKTIEELNSLGVTSLVLLLDNDEAGKKRLKSLIHQFYSKTNVDFYVLDMSEFSDIKDPDDLIRKRGIEAFKGLAETNALEWLCINEIAEGSDTYKVLQEITPLIAREHSPLNRMKIASTISEMTDIPKDTIIEEIDRKIASSKDRKSEFAVKILEEAKDLILMNPNAISAAVDLIQTKISSMEVDKSSEDLFSSSEFLNSVYKIREQEDSGLISPIIKTGFRLFDKHIQLPYSECFALVPASPNAGKCLKFDTLIQMPDGSQKTVQKVYEDKDRFILTMDKNHKIVKGEISDWYDSGELECINVKTRDGIDISTSSTHPFYTINGWKKVSELSVGDKIAISKNYNNFEEIDSDITKEECHLLGLMLGDGTFREAFRFTTIDNEIVKIFKGLIDKIFPGCTIANYGDDYNVCDKTKLLNNNKSRPKEWVRSFGLWNTKSDTKFIPDIVFKASKEKIAFLLSGLFDTDGTVGDRGIEGSNLSLSLSNEKMIKQVRSLLLRFGIKSSIHSKIHKYTNKYGEKISGIRNFNLVIRDISSIIKFKENIILNVSYKQDNINSICEKFSKRTRGSYKNNYPKELWLYIDELMNEKGITYHKIIRELYPDRIKIGKSKEGWQRKYIHHKPKKNCNINQKLLSDINLYLDDPFLTSLLEGDIYFDEIIELSNIGKYQCYDLTIENTHNFIANDFIAHNTHGLINLAQGMIKNNEDIIVIMHTIDDSRNVYQNRFISSMCNTKINWIKNPTVFLDDDMKEKRNQAYNLFEDWILSEKLIIKDVTHGNTVEYVKNLIRHYRDKYPNKQIVLFEDNFHKLITELGYEDSNVKFKYISNELKSLTTKYECNIFCTVEMAKNDMYTRHTTAESIKETGALQYDANLIIFLWNEINGLREDAALKFETTSLEYNKETQTYSHTVVENPIIEWIVLKNKISEFKLSLYYKLFPDLAKIEEVDPNTIQNLIFKSQELNKAKGKKW